MGVVKKDLDGDCGVGIGGKPWELSVDVDRMNTSGSTRWLKTKGRGKKEEGLKERRKWK